MAGQLGLAAPTYVPRCRSLSSGRVYCGFLNVAIARMHATPWSLEQNRQLRRQRRTALGSVRYFGINTKMRCYNNDVCLRTPTVQTRVQLCCLREGGGGCSGCLVGGVGVSRKITNVLEVRLRIQGTHSLRTYRALREYMCVFLAGGSGTGLVYFGWHWPAWEYSLLLMFTRCIKIHLRDLTLGATY